MLSTCFWSSIRNFSTNYPLHLLPGAQEPKGCFALNAEEQPRMAHSASHPCPAGVLHLCCTLILFWSISVRDSVPLGFNPSDLGSRVVKSWFTEQIYEKFPQRIGACLNQNEKQSSLVIGHLFSTALSLQEKLEFSSPSASCSRILGVINTAEIVF